MGLSHSISTSPISIIESICTSTTTTTTPTIPAIASVAPATDAAAPTTHSPKGKWGERAIFNTVSYLVPSTCTHSIYLYYIGSI